MKKEIKSFIEGDQSILKIGKGSNESNSEEEEVELIPEETVD